MTIASRMFSRRRSSIRLRRRIISSTWPSSSIANGGVSDSARCSASVTDSSISPVLRFGLTLPSSRRTISPAALTHVLGPQPLRQRVRLGRRLRMEDELDDAGAVAQVDEDQAAVVAAAVDPAGHAHRARRRVRRRAHRPRRRGTGSRVVVSKDVPPDVVHDGFGRDELVLTAVAVAKLDAVVAEDGNVARRGCATPA